ncbi:helix-turn-helix transcriptional regulator [Mangrovicella endophytica]|uniref:helix-turn-helix transcriptional regulator n=1 Tax=Mangrovicella endophytica TaxID=2066697 RepID=UPI000C9E6209|nr:AraC family transcriptional regulator [Mangrovicella endophytica]
MSEVVSNWAVSAAPNLVGVARRQLAEGERIAIDCRGKTVVFLVLDGEFTMGRGPATSTLRRGDACFIRDRMAPDGSGDALPQAISSSATMLWASFHPATPALNTAVHTLPPVIRVPAEDSVSADGLRSITVLLRHEFNGDTCGRELLIGHLCEALFLYIIRYWYDRFSNAACILDAFGDPSLARVIEHIHQSPDHPWTLNELAGIAGLSRAAFARRFRTAIEDTPLGYITRWRMSLASLLLDQSASIAKVSGELGYTSEFAFSRAFKRYHGLSPAHYRDRSAGAR